MLKSKSKSTRCWGEKENAMNEVQKEDLNHNSYSVLYNICYAHKKKIFFTSYKICIPIKKFLDIINSIGFSFFGYR